MRRNLLLTISLEIGVNPFLPLWWVVRDRTSCPRPGIPTGRWRAGQAGIPAGASTRVFQLLHRPKADAPDEPLQSPKII